MIIDAHHHLWTGDYPWLADPALGAIRRDYTVDDLRVHLHSAGVDRTVLVEAGLCEDSETVAFLRLAEETPEIAGVVGWASLTDPDLAAKLATYAESGWLVGVRDQIQAHDVDHLDRADVRDGLRQVTAAGLVNELVVRCEQLPSVARVAAALPEASFVLDHLGKPPIAAGGLSEWRAAMEPVARCPNVSAKLSGLVTEADWSKWTVADIAPFVETAVELFGGERLLFGSDWPVCELAASYEQVTDTLVTILGGRPAEIFGGTAARVYGLEV